MSTKRETQKPIGLWERFSLQVTNAIGNAFYRLGYLVALHPWNTIIVAILIAGTCSVGLIRFRIEKNPLELWIPKDSSYLKNTKWALDRMEYIFRPQGVLITSPENVLRPDVIEKLIEIHHNVVNLNVTFPNGTSIGWDDVCLKVPFIAEIKPPSETRRRRQLLPPSDDIFGDDFNQMLQQIESTKKRIRDPSVEINPAIYCKVIEKLPFGCYEQNLGEIWSYDLKTIDHLTQQQILEDIKKTTVGPVSGHTTDFTVMLGGKIKNITGHVTSAKAVLSVWFLKLNFSEIDMETTGNLAGTETWVSDNAYEWEGEFLKKMETLKSQLEDNETNIYFFSQRSFGDLSQEAMFQEYDKFILGGFMMFVYIQLVLSKLSWTELRLSLGSLGMLSVVMAFLSSSGICSAFGVFYGPVHTSLPFLLMGLGIDDMFVMMACWRDTDVELATPERVGNMLRRAGAAITVTSLTDMIAFFVGSLSVLPSLRDYCLFAAVGIFMTYFFAITFYIAVFVLDERRIKANRNSIAPCIKHSDEGAKLWCDAKIMQRSFDFIYSKFILTKVGKIIVVMSVIGLSGLSINGLLKIPQKFDPLWFVPQDTYFIDFTTNAKIYYPDSGYEALVFFGNTNYSESLPEIHQLVQEIETRNDVFYEVTAWISHFFEFVENNYYKDLTKTILTDYEWRFYLSKFLYSKAGGKFQANFRFVTPLKCGQPVPNITISWFDFKFRRFNSRDDYVPAMHEIERIIGKRNFTAEYGEANVFSWAKIYANWITDEIIDKEVIRNISLALVCVMLCTAIVIINLQMCFWILVCVVLTIINICGFMYLWGLTIDLVSCIALQLAIGLCVDYAAHVGHSFLSISKGNRQDRALNAIKHIGSAVFNGGGSTLLAIAFLGFSKAYVFQSFFKIFLLVSIFGLFHGLVFLPVILSLIGPAPYERNVTETNEDFHEEEMVEMMNGKKNTNAKAQNGTKNGTTLDESETLSR